MRWVTHQKAGLRQALLAQTEAKASFLKATTGSSQEKRISQLFSSHLLTSLYMIVIFLPSSSSFV